MSIIVHLFVRLWRGASLEDLGKFCVTPKPMRTALMGLDDRGRLAIAESHSFFHTIGRSGPMSFRRFMSI
jgi:hypothetical protein